MSPPSFSQSTHKAFALHAVTGVAALFGLNTHDPLRAVPERPAPAPAPDEADDLHAELAYTQGQVRDLRTQLERLRHVELLLRAERADLTMLALLGHIERAVCLSGHSSNEPHTLARTLGVDAFTLELTQLAAAEQGLTTRERAWTGSWHRVILTPAGRARLDRLRRSLAAPATG